MRLISGLTSGLNIYFLAMLVVVVVRRRRNNENNRGYAAGGTAYAKASSSRGFGSDDYQPIVRGELSSSSSSTRSGTEV